MEPTQETPTTLAPESQKTSAPSKSLVGRSPGKGLLYTSIVIFVCVLASLIGLTLVNASLDATISSQRDEIAAKSRAISELNSNPRIAGYGYYDRAKSDIESSIRGGEVQRYIAEVQSIENTYHLVFQGFSYTDGKVSTSASAERGDGTGAIDKVVKLVADYRTDSAKLFSLDPIYSVVGDADKKNFPVSFRVNLDVLSHLAPAPGGALSGSTVGSATSTIIGASSGTVSTRVISSSGGTARTGAVIQTGTTAQTGSTNN